MKIVVLSRSEYIYSTARLMEEAEYNGHDVEMVNPLECKLLLEKNHPQVLVDNNVTGGIDAIIPRIGSTFTQCGAAVIRQYEMMQTFSTLSSSALLSTRDKLHTLQCLSQKGIDFPKTLYFSPDFEWNIPEILSYIGKPPVIVKVIEGTQGLGVMLLESKISAISTIEALQSLKAKFILQEYISEAKGKDLRIIVINGKVIAAMQRKGKDDDFRSNIHRGGRGMNVNITPQEESIALKVCKIMGLKIAGVDIIRSKRGPLLLEINSSPGFEGIENTTKINVAQEVIRYVENSVKKNV